MECITALCLDICYWFDQKLPRISISRILNIISWFSHRLQGVHVFGNFNSLELINQVVVAAQFFESAFTRVLAVNEKVEERRLLAIIRGLQPNILMLLRLNYINILLSNTIEPPMLLILIVNSLLVFVKVFHTSVIFIIWSKNLNAIAYFPRVDDGIDLVDVVWQLEFINLRRLWLWLWFWLSRLNQSRHIWQNLIYRQRSLPEHANGTPKAPPIHANEAEPFKGHGILVIVNIGVHELVRRYPLGKCASMLPHIQVVLRLLPGLLILSLLPRGVHITPIKERTARSIPRKRLYILTNRAVSLTRFRILRHQFGRRHVKCLYKGL